MVDTLSIFGMLDFTFLVLSAISRKDLKDKDIRKLEEENSTPKEDLSRCAPIVLVFTPDTLTPCERLTQNDGWRFLSNEKNDKYPDTLA